MKARATILMIGITLALIAPAAQAAAVWGDGATATSSTMTFKANTNHRDTNHRKALIAGVIAMSARTPFGLVAPTGRPSEEARARATVGLFFDTINARQYARTCDLLSVAYYQRYRLLNKERCALGLRVGFMWTQEIHYRITSVDVNRDRAVVETLADGVPGQIVLVREGEALKVVAVQGT
jgi:hypothetical protein